MHKYHVMIEKTLHTPAFKIKLHCITKTDNMQQTTTSTLLSTVVQHLQYKEEMYIFSL